jgi:DnaJ-class molecular chaperone
MAYYTAAKQNHPDIKRDDPHAKEKFQQVADAYELLSDPVKRRIYDTTGSRGGGGQGDNSAGAGFHNAYEVCKCIKSHHITSHHTT